MSVSNCQAESSVGGLDECQRLRAVSADKVLLIQAVANLP
jgi:hypothetical protein